MHSGDGAACHLDVEGEEHPWQDEDPANLLVELALRGGVRGCKGTYGEVRGARGCERVSRVEGVEGAASEDV